jgi:hypothetical protein
MAIAVIEVYHKVTGQRAFMSESALAIFTDYAAVPVTGPPPGPFDPLPQYLTDQEWADKVKDPATIVGAAGRAAFASANPDVVINRDATTGLVVSVVEDGVSTVLTRDPVTKKVATIKRGDAPAKTIVRDAQGQVTGVAA